MFKTGIFSNFIILLSAKIIRIKNDRVYIYIEGSIIHEITPDPGFTMTIY